MSRLTTPRLFRWLQGEILAIDNKIKVVKGRLEDMPDRMVCVTKGIGRGESLGGEYEYNTWEITSRGMQDSLDDAESIADIVDGLVLGKATNLFFEDCHILSSSWAGSGPQQLAISDPQSRFMYMCNYTIESSMT